ncbi:MAG: glycosyltransferase [Thermodesulfobacteriota bacterium]
MSGKRIRIALVVEKMPLVPSGGTEAQLQQLITRMDPERFSFLLCPIQPFTEEQIRSQAAPVVGVNAPHPLKPSCWPGILRFSRFLVSRRVDVVHTFFRDPNMAGIAAARLARVPVIVSGRRNLGFWIDRKELFLLKFFNRFVTRFSANSELAADTACRKEGISRDRVDVILNGVDEELFRPADEKEKTRARAALGVPSQARVAAFVSNLRPVKRPDVFLQAFAGLLPKVPDACALVVGGGPAAERARELSQSLGLEGRALFLGRILDIRPVLAAADLGVLSSDSESLPNAILEYMAAGLPVAATKVGAVPELIADGENGLLAPAGDAGALARAMETLLSDPARTVGMGARSREIVLSRFRFARCVREHEEYYTRLVERFGRRT